MSVNEMLVGERAELWARESSSLDLAQDQDRLDAHAKVTGSAMFASDVHFPGQLCAAVLRSPWPHARVRHIESVKARSLPGVVAVVTRDDALESCWYRERRPLFDSIVRFVGDEVAAVAAESDEVLSDALALIDVEYEPLPFVVDMTEAVQDQAALVHENGNVADVQAYERGNAEAAFAESEVRITETYSTQAAFHNALESHATVAIWRGDELTLYESTQGVFVVRDCVAAQLKLPNSRVRVVAEHVGGGFGAKQSLCKQTIIAALLARRTGRPVRLVADRVAENLAMGYRNPTRQIVRIGASHDGSLRAICMDGVRTCGAYRTGGESSLIEGIYQHLYRCNNVKTSLKTVYTNIGPSVAFRAPGYAEGAFALESAMDELAQRLAMDPVELRIKNYTERDQTKARPWSAPAALRTCYRRADDVFGWSKYEPKRCQSSKRRGIGLAAHDWVAGSGSPPAYVLITLDVDSSVQIVAGTQDIGTGTRTILAQSVAEVIGLPVNCMRVHIGDTANALYAPTSAGSHTTPTLVSAAKAAAANAREQLLKVASEQMGICSSFLDCRDGSVVRIGSADVALKVLQITQSLAPRRICGFGSYSRIPSDVTVRPFGVLCAEVEVDTKSLEIRLLRIVYAPDCGRVINQKLAQSQIIGGVTQGIGFALMEDRVIDLNLGVILNPNLEDYLIPTALDVPEIVHALVDIPDFNANASGAKGLGELPIIAVAPAIANAVSNAIGVRIRDLPISRLKIQQAIQSRSHLSARGSA